MVSVVKDLYKSLKILSAELIPWHNLRKQDENEGIKVADLLFMVDTMMEEIENKEKVRLIIYFILSLTWVLYILTFYVSEIFKVFEVL